MTNPRPEDPCSQSVEDWGRSFEQMGRREQPPIDGAEVYNPVPEEPVTITGPGGDYLEEDDGGFGSSCLGYLLIGSILLYPFAALIVWWVA